MYLFVCTGNTCRSPMAAAIFRMMGYEAESAGLYAMPGASASAGAIRAMENAGLDISNHRARPVSREAMERAEKIVTMTSRHAQALCEQFPAYRDKILCMPREISDPFGGDDDDYLACAREIEGALRLL